ncbi:MAG: CpsB/CapC family capsule biosynthesis tyrosine phosphatase [Candidatus Fimenecus sp.]
MTDIHCHIVYAIDDGCENLDDSLKLGYIGKENGIDRICATPHFIDYRRYDEFIAIRNSHIEMINSELSDSGLDLSVCAGAEIFLSEWIYSVGNLDGLTLNGSNYTLCEYSLKSMNPEKCIEYAEEVLSMGYKLIIAHPERYKTFYEYPFVPETLLKMGVYFQVNSMSLAGYGGEEERLSAEKYVLDGSAVVIGTDSHRPYWRANDFKNQKKEFSASITDDIIEKLTVINPEKILSDQII